MIYGLGNKHSSIPQMRPGIYSAVEDLDPDVIFVEDVPNSYKREVYFDNRDEIQQRVEPELPAGLSLKDAVGSMGFNEGIELQVLDSMDLDSEVRYLDEDFEKEKLIYVITEYYRQQQEEIEHSSRNPDILTEDFEQDLSDLQETGINSLYKSLVVEEPEKEDYIDFFRYIIDRQDHEFDYVALGTEDRFWNYLPRVFDSYLMFNGSSDSVKQEFTANARELGVNQQDLQEVIMEGRNSEFQDRRDTSWSQLVSDYAENKPEDDILVIGGLNHFLEAPDTFVGQMSEKGHEVEVFPLDHYLHVDGPASMNED